MNLLAPWGFYGWGNIGDEATLQGFARLLSLASRPFRVWAGSRNPSHTARVEPAFSYFHSEEFDWRRWWANCCTSAVVVAGGTPIMDCHGDWPFCELAPLIETAHQQKKPVAFVGAGTERLHRTDSRRTFAERIAPFVRRWTVRSEPDQSRLIEYGVSPDQVQVAGDMAWLLGPASVEWGRDRLQSWGVPRETKLVGVNLMNEKPVRDRHPRLFETIAQFLDLLVEQDDVTVLFLANDVKESIGLDRAATMRTLAAMKHRDKTFLAPNDYLPPQQMMSLIANCDVTLSMRYHFCLFSALQSVPFIALKRSDKVADLCWDLNWQFGASLDQLLPSDLTSTFDSIDAHRSAVVEQLRLRIPVLRERASQNLIAIEALEGK